MTREQLRIIIDNAAGNPSSGTVADLIDTLTDAINDAINPDTVAVVEKRVTEPTETR